MSKQKICKPPKDYKYCLLFLMAVMALLSSCSIMQSSLDEAVVPTNPKLKIPKDDSLPKPISENKMKNTE